MHDRTVVLTIGLTAMVLLAGCTSSFAPESATAPGGEDEADSAKSITVSASGTAETSPDQAVVLVAVVVVDEDASIVREQLAENASRLRAALEDLGIDSDQIRTSHYDIDRDHRRPPREREGDTEVRYRGVHAFDVRLSNTSKIGEVIDVSVQNGATDVRGVRFTLSKSARRDLQNRALEDAMDGARSQAETVAAKGNLEITGVDTIQTADRRDHTLGERAAAGDAGGPSTTIDTAPVTIRTQVRVTYNATEA